MVVAVPEFLLRNVGPESKTKTVYFKTATKVQYAGDYNGVFTFHFMVS